jgi:hypothetical protein
MTPIKQFVKRSLLTIVGSGISLGLAAGAAQAAGSGQPSLNKIVKVNCDKGQSVQRALLQFETWPKPLVLVISGVCEEDVEIERDEVEFQGADSGGRITGGVFIDEAREFGLAENMRIGRLSMGAGQAEIEVEEGSVVIDNGISLTGQSVLSMGSEGPGSITVNADIIVENQSLLTTDFEEGSGGGVVINGGISMILQSSANMDGTSVSSGISMSQDSHALLGIGVTVSGSITCDRQSRVWGDISGVSFVLTDVDGESCWGNAP